MFDFTGQSGQNTVIRCVVCYKYVAVAANQKVWHPLYNGHACPSCSETLRKGESA